ncbi:rab-GTPase-TBC domain-containing protein [Zychaea mexicana]|uniref:rab-GTPase-TBC domain-containing protein n=1 Tax=Zychaea mexicana TaxID=64656 RepID=UPI0022FDEF46|nr:rab-GTPase-TBC domain-containing protein [Zychaea mexicana]KAI9490639.1 rab-GTPase-TBC domain-containing protein [Zychaea mexicana]
MIPKAIPPLWIPPPTRVRRQRGLTVTQTSRPSGPGQPDEEDDEDDYSTADDEDDEYDGDKVNNDKDKEASLQQQQQQQQNHVHDDNEELSKQIQDLMVQDRQSFEDDFVHDNGNDDADIDDGRSSPKSLHSTASSSYSVVSSASNYDLLLARLGTPQQGSEIATGQSSSSSSSFDQVAAPDSMSQVSLEQHEASRIGEEEIDWEFWSKVVSDFKAVKASTLRHHLQRGGVPPSLRGTVWPLLAKSKDSRLEDQYMRLLKSESVYEKAIIRDLARTFADNEYFQSKDGQEALFNVAKAYSLYDTDVGYCQGVLFIAAPLLLNMPEEEAFCVLVQIMTRYELRGQFKPQPDLLSQRLYQLTYLANDHLPHVHRHFELQGIQTNMYAMPWFISLFAFKFPLDVVFRIYDNFLSDGVEVLFRVALALLEKNQSNILVLEYDKLLQFLKHDLLRIYTDNTSSLIYDAYRITIPAKRLDKLAKQFQADVARSNSEAEAIDKLKRQNKALHETVRQLQGNLNDINREHGVVAKELIESKMEIARIHDENDALRQQSFDLKRALETLPQEVESRVKEEMQILAGKNAALVKRNTTLEDQLAYMENMVLEIKAKFADSEDERANLQQRLGDLKRLMD